MQITEINPQKKKGRYNIFVDGAFYSGIDALSLLSANLKVGQEVTKEDLERYVLESETRSAFDKMARMLASPHTKKEVRDKLSKTYTPVVIERAIKKAEEYGYLSDKEYATLFVNSKPLNSRQEIKSKLYSKGINRQIIEESLSSISEEDEKSRAEILSKKYLKNKNLDVKAMQGLYGFLTRKGFSSEVASSMVRKYKEFED